MYVNYDLSILHYDLFLHTLVLQNPEQEIKNIFYEPVFLRLHIYFTLPIVPYPLKIFINLRPYVSHGATRTDDDL